AAGSPDPSWSRACGTTRSAGFLGAAPPPLAQTPHGRGIGEAERGCGRGGLLRCDAVRREGLDADLVDQLAKRDAGLRESALERSLGYPEIARELREGGPAPGARAEPGTRVVEERRGRRE